MTTTPASPLPQSTPSPADTTDNVAQRAGFVQGALFGALLTATLIGALLWFLWQPTPASMTLQPPEMVEQVRMQQAEVLPPGAPATQLAPSTPGPLMVHVSGAVVAPGVYELPAAARADAAIEAAGGYATDANQNVLNLASILQDGMRLHVPTLDEEVALPPAGLSTVPAPVVGAEPGEVESATVNPASVAPGAAQSNAGGGLINVNRASLAELQALPGVGAVRAQAIIDGRPYVTVEDLDRVTGIGPATIENLRGLVSFN